jgi:hypothetical protein
MGVADSIYGPPPVYVPSYEKYKKRGAHPYYISKMP